MNNKKWRLYTPVGKGYVVFVNGYLVFANIIFDKVKQVSLFKFTIFWYILLIIKNEDLPFFLLFSVKIIIVFILIIFWLFNFYLLEY